MQNSCTSVDLEFRQQAQHVERILAFCYAGRELGWEGGYDKEACGRQLKNAMLLLHQLRTAKSIPTEEVGELIAAAFASFRPRAQAYYGENGSVEWDDPILFPPHLYPASKASKNDQFASNTQAPTAAPSLLASDGLVPPPLGASRTLQDPPRQRTPTQHPSSALPRHTGPTKPISPSPHQKKAPPQPIAASDTNVPETRRILPLPARARNAVPLNIAASSSGIEPDSTTPTPLLPQNQTDPPATLRIRIPTVVRTSTSNDNPALRLPQASLTSVARHDDSRVAADEQDAEMMDDDVLQSDDSGESEVEVVSDVHVPTTGRKRKSVSPPFEPSIDDSDCEEIPPPRPSRKRKIAPMKVEASEVPVDLRCNLCVEAGSETCVHRCLVCIGKDIYCQPPEISSRSTACKACRSGASKKRCSLKPYFSRQKALLKLSTAQAKLDATTELSNRALEQTKRESEPIRRQPPRPHKGQPNYVEPTSEGEGDIEMMGPDGANSKDERTASVKPRSRKPKKNTPPAMATPLSTIYDPTTMEEMDVQIIADPRPPQVLQPVEGKHLPADAEQLSSLSVTQSLAPPLATKTLPPPPSTQIRSHPLAAKTLAPRVETDSSALSEKLLPPPLSEKLSTRPAAKTLPPAAEQVSCPSVAAKTLPPAAGKFFSLPVAEKVSLPPLGEKLPSRPHTLAAKTLPPLAEDGSSPSVAEELSSRPHKLAAKTLPPLVKKVSSLPVVEKAGNTGLGINTGIYCPTEKLQVSSRLHQLPPVAEGDSLLSPTEEEDLMSMFVQAIAETGVRITDRLLHSVEDRCQTLVDDITSQVVKQLQPQIDTLASSAVQTLQPTLASMGTNRSHQTRSSSRAQSNAPSVRSSASPKPFVVPAAETEVHHTTQRKLDTTAAIPTVDLQSTIARLQEEIHQLRLGQTKDRQDVADSVARTQAIEWKFYAEGDFKKLIHDAVQQYTAESLTEYIKKEDLVTEVSAAGFPKSSDLATKADIARFGPLVDWMRIFSDNTVQSMTNLSRRIADTQEGVHSLERLAVITLTHQGMQANLAELKKDIDKHYSADNIPVDSGSLRTILNQQIEHLSGEFGQGRNHHTVGGVDAFPATAAPWQLHYEQSTPVRLPPPPTLLDAPGAMSVAANDSPFGLQHFIQTPPSLRKPLPGTPLSPTHNFQPIHDGNSQHSVLGEDEEGQT